MTKDTDHFMPLYPDDYLRDTTNLNAETHGAYLLLLMTSWIRGGTLPDDDIQLASIARLSIRRWRILKPVLRAFFQVAEGAWTHKRVGKELERARRIIDARRSAGRKGAASRWQSDGKAIGKPDDKGMTNTMTNRQQIDGPSHFTLNQGDRSRSSSLVKGARRARKAKLIDFARPENRQAWARQKMQEFVSAEILMAAEDPRHPNHRQAVKLARAAADKAEVTWRAPKEGG